MEQHYTDLNTIWEAIRQANEIALFRHINPDPDAYGAQFALAHVIHDNFPEKTVFCYGERVERLHYLYESGRIFYADLPKTLADTTLAIAVDTANLARLDVSGLSTVPRVDVKIDHHPAFERYARLEFVMTDTPATSAILLDYFLFLQRMDSNFVISTTVYEKLYAGIVGDTGNFRYGNGLNEAFFRNVGVLFEKVDTKKLLELFFAKTLAEVHFAGMLATAIQVDGQFAYVEFDSAVVEEAGVTLDYATSLVHIMSELADVTIWAVFCEDQAAGNIRCNLRSRYADVSVIARQFGGGGHVFASGVRASSWEEVAQIKAALKALSLAT